jgi:hypothetical protein
MVLFIGFVVLNEFSLFNVEARIVFHEYKEVI